ncbi:MAG: hypothetical protein PWQ49_232 [Methanohalophilus sp.]|nr:hypothetical protein [Methanohalophilus sp.]
MNLKQDTIILLVFLVQTGNYSYKKYNGLVGFKIVFLQGLKNTKRVWISDTIYVPQK